METTPCIGAKTFLRTPAVAAAWHRHCQAVTVPATTFLVSHRLALQEAPNAYLHFGKRDDGWTKVLLKPGT